MFLIVYARIYGQSFLNAIASIGRNAWTLMLPVALSFAFIALGSLLAPLGLVGGILLSLARTAGCSIYSYFLAQLVAKNRVSLSDLKTSIGAYFWTWMNLFFVLWILDWALSGFMKTNPQLTIVVMLMELVILNAAPETIYLKGTYGGLETIQRSFHFLQENWIEWFIPNGLVLGACALVLVGTVPLAMLPFAALTVPVVVGVLTHVVMVFRGFLYQVLDGSTHRQRMFRFRGTL
jgi:hypothetical protein